MNEAFEKPNRLYESISLGNSIELCKKENLITEKEKKILFDTIRELMRNGFSHADTSKILANVSDDMPMFQTTLKNPSQIEKISLNPKVVPFLQTLAIAQFAKSNATNYFSFVFNLLEKLESRLLGNSP